MGEISEALGRARKEEKGSQRASRAGDLPASRKPAETKNDARSSEPKTAQREATDSDRMLHSKVVAKEAAENAAGTPARNGASQARTESGAASPRQAPSGRAPRLVDMTEDAKAEEAPSTQTSSGQAAPRHEAHHVISRERNGDWVERLCVVDPQGPQAVRFRHLAVKVRSTLDTLSRRSILVTSALPGEGKTTVSINLALALASIATEYRIALVDMDLRRGRIGRTLGYEAGLGLESVLEGRASLDDVRVQTDLPSLDFFPIAQSMPDAHRVLGGAAQGVLEELNRKYDYVVIDGPPVLPVPDVPLLAPYVGGCLAVVASGRTRQAAFRDLLELLPRNAILGVFLNESRSAVVNSRYAYYEASDPAQEPKAEAEKKISGGHAAVAAAHESVVSAPESVDGTIGAEEATQS